MFMKLRISSLFMCLIVIAGIMTLTTAACSRTSQGTGDTKETVREEGTPALNYGEIADFLAGKAIPKDSKLFAFTQTAQYKSYAGELNHGWDKFQKPNLHKMETWWKEHAVRKSEKNVLYPFSGPDIMNVLAFFPDSESYTMFGLETVGAIPDPYSMNDAQMKAGFVGVRKSLNSILQVNFFRTESMATDIGNASFNGITGLVMIFLAKKDYTVIDVKKIVIDSNSEISAGQKSDDSIDWQKPPKSQRIPGMEITFRKGQGKTQRVRYFMLNVIDQALATTTPNFIPFIRKGAPYSAFLKSASYLMHNDDVKFTQIRAMVLSVSSSIVQDDSGVPLRYLNTNEWDISFHGVYDRPISLFANRAQSDLKEAFKKNSTGILPFSYGYDYKKDRSNLTIAEKKTAGK